MKQFEKFGYFINDDGVKSTDVDLTTRTFKNNVTLPKSRISTYNAYIRHQFDVKRKVMGGEAKCTEVVKALAVDWS